MYKTCINCCPHRTTCTHHTLITRCALLHTNFFVHYPLFCTFYCHMECSVCQFYAVTAIVQYEFLQYLLYTWRHIVFVYCCLYHTGVRGGAFAWDTTLKNQKVAGSIPEGVIGIFNWHNLSGRTTALGLTQSLKEMSTRNISWGGVKVAGA